MVLAILQILYVSYHWLGQGIFTEGSNSIPKSAESFSETQKRAQDEKTDIINANKGQKNKISKSGDKKRHDMANNNENVDDNKKGNNLGKVISVIMDIKRKSTDLNTIENLNKILNNLNKIQRDDNDDKKKSGEKSVSDIINSKSESGIDNGNNSNNNDNNNNNN